MFGIARGCGNTFNLSVKCCRSVKAARASPLRLREVRERIDDPILLRQDHRNSSAAVPELSIPIRTSAGWPWSPGPSSCARGAWVGGGAPFPTRQALRVTGTGDQQTGATEKHGQVQENPVDRATVRVVNASAAKPRPRVHRRHRRTGKCRDLSTVSREHSMTAGAIGR